MTIEERKLLLKDLCYRSPYNVIIYIIGIGNKVLNYIDLEDEFVNCAPLETIRPYLRSMSNMTDDEKTELFQLMGNGTDIQRIDFYNSHYFDYRCLIDKNLEIEAPEKLYLSKNIYSTYMYQVPDPDDDTQIEYVRKDAFIEKAVNFLEMLGYGFTITDNITKSLYDNTQLIEDFKNYMTNEN